MVDIHVFLIGLLLTSTLTSLVTEAVKNILVEHNITYRANTLAGIVSVVLSIAIAIGYAVIASISVTPQFIVCVIAQIFMSWLCAMIGYDKVLQAIEQFKMDKIGDE